ncbi:MAG: ferrous iron transport protein B [Phycisphaerae bacterium]|jgi:ferrous iron transport protein B|nr:ferrous iron transport protein B [Phycisphaerae bacterium]
MSRLNIALAGNPNSGKTTIFNLLTGERQHVGNYPGVTVEKKQGSAVFADRELDIVDLPGTYSLTAYTIEEIVTRNFIMESEPDVVIDIVDCSNLERNLYLATQLLECGVPLVLAFNKSDLAEVRGFHIDCERLSNLLGVPIVETVGTTGGGLDELLARALEVADAGPEAVAQQRLPDYGTELEPHVVQTAREIAHHCGLERHSRWFALKLLEGDSEALKRVQSLASEDHGQQVTEIIAETATLRKHIEDICGDSPEIVFADRRYGFISGACTEAVEQTVEARHDLSDRIDAVMTNPIMGLPIFIAMMYVVFQLTFTIGQWPMGWIEDGFVVLSKQLAMLWGKGSESLLKSLLIDGIIGGVGGVIVFLPNILLLFAGIAVLEDSGYMARAAFVMDRWMHKIGLHGKSFIPMLIGFGCNVPAIMATRTLETRRDRMTTMLVIPLMSCGARLPIYALIIPAFFPSAWHGPMLWTMYLIGIVLAIVLARLLRSTLFKGESAAFVMDLPPYRMPTAKGLLVHMWERSWMYLRKAGTVILGVSVVMWALAAFPRISADELDAKYANQKQTAHATYTARLAGVNTLLGVAPEDSVIDKALGAEMTLAEAGGEFFEHEQGYIDAQAARDSTIASLTAGPGGDVLKSFIDARTRILEARETFAQRIADEELQEGSRQYAAIELYRDRELEKIAKDHPQAGAAALLYLDECAGPYVQAMVDIENSQLLDRTSRSILGRIGRAIEPVVRPMGFDWRIGTALLGSFAAKEVFVAQMGIVYSVGEGSDDSGTLRKKLSENYTPLIGFCIMLYCLVSAPCVATIAATWQESGRMRWAMAQLAGLTLLAYVLTTAVYQIGRLLG